MSTSQLQSYSDVLRMPITPPKLLSQPEHKCQISTHSDVFIMKCVMKTFWCPRWFSQIHYNCIPFAGRSEGQIMFLVVIQDKRPHRQDEPPLSDGAWEVIQRCWAKEPWRRPRMEDVIGNLVVTSQSMSLSTKISSFPVTSSFSATTSVRRPRFLSRILY